MLVTLFTRGGGSSQGEVEEDDRDANSKTWPPLRSHSGTLFPRGSLRRSLSLRWCSSVFIPCFFASPPPSLPSPCLSYLGLILLFLVVPRPIGVVESFPRSFVRSFVSIRPTIRISEYQILFA